MRKVLILALVLCLLAACGGGPPPTPDLVATQIAVEIAAHATMTAMVPTATSRPKPTETPVPTVTPTPAPTVTPSPAIEAEEYAVYAALIEQGAIPHATSSSPLIRGFTSVSDADELERTLEHAGPLPADLVGSYLSRNADSYTLSPSLNLEQGYALMSQEDYDQILPPGKAKWDEFEEQYPEADGFFFFSRVGFNADETMALALVGFRCPGLCGYGGLYLLAKEDGIWKIQDTLMTWMS